MNSPSCLRTVLAAPSAKLIALLSACLGVGLLPSAGAAPTDGAPQIVLVHGALIDGSSWRGVYDYLTRDGFQVHVVQQPLTGLAEDVAATERVINQVKGSVVLVGHSYGGTIITVAGANPKVRALVYVAALQPEVGETSNLLASSKPGKVSSDSLSATPDGFVFFDPVKFPAEVGADVPAAQAHFLAQSQMPIAAAALDAPVKTAAWHDKPSFGIIATEDRELSTELAHWMYARSGAKITEVKGSHLIQISQPRAVADVIESAARSVR